MKRTFYTFWLRHRADPKKFTGGRASRTLVEHVKAMNTIKSNGSAVYDKIIDFGRTEFANITGIKEPAKHATHSQHKPKTSSNKN